MVVGQAMAAAMAVVAAPMATVAVAVAVTPITRKIDFLRRPLAVS